jgi:hypothetical protein
MKRVILLLILSLSVSGCAVDLHINNKKGLSFTRSLSLEPNTVLTIDFDKKNKVDISIKNKSSRTNILLTAGEYQKSMTSRQSISLKENTGIGKLTLANTGTRKSKVQVKIKSSNNGQVVSKVNKIE